MAFQCPFYLPGPSLQLISLTAAFTAMSLLVAAAPDSLLAFLVAAARDSSRGNILGGDRQWAERVDLLTGDHWPSSLLQFKRRFTFLR